MPSLLTISVGAEDYELIGDWMFVTVEPTLMDDGYEVIVWTEGRQGVTIGITDIGPMVIIQFEAYIAGGGERYEAAILGASDVKAPAKLPVPFLDTDGRALAWQGEAAETVLGYFRGASVVMFRTTDYRGRRVDFVAELDPEDFTAAWDRLTRE